MSRYAVILPAAGKSSRFSGKEKKPFANLDGRAIWLRTAELFVTRDDICQTIVIIAPGEMETFKQRYQANLAFLSIEVAEGGKERFDSVANALTMIKDEADFVAVHDAVRPCVTAELIDAVFASAEKNGAAMLAVPVPDTLKRVNKDKKIEETLSREGIWLAQTPQVFRREWLQEAYDQREKIKGTITDDAQLIEAMGHEVTVVESDRSNIKITTKADVRLADAILKSRPEAKPSGPAHPFAEDEMWR